LRVISSGGKISTIPLNSSLPSGEKIYLFLKYLIPLERNSPPPEVPKLSLVVFLSPGGDLMIPPRGKNLSIFILLLESSLEGERFTYS